MGECERVVRRIALGGLEEISEGLRKGKVELVEEEILHGRDGE